jgi:3-deoxy-D-manno-octulosonic-acid transferase
MLQFFAYNLILTGVLPLILLWGIVRLLKGKSRHGWGQRFGFLGKIGQEPGNPQRGPRIWVHACSVGEVNAILPVIKNLRKQFPAAIIFFSTITPTGQAQARRVCPEADAIFYFPFDLALCQGLALRFIRPDLCILTERELWPNFLSLCQMQRIPVLVANGIVTEHSSALNQWVPGFMRWRASLVDFYSVQTENSRERLLAMGVETARIAVDGNTKSDQPMPEAGKEEALAQVLGWTPASQWLVAGSTHAGEEEIVLDAFALVHAKVPAAQLVLAPRHPERTTAVVALVEKTGLPFVRRSELVNHAVMSHHPAAIVILDTIGELTLAYRLCRGAFVGGSLVANVGGHNPLEVTAEGKPVFFGSQMQNCRDVADLLCRQEVGFTVQNAAELAMQWHRALSDTNWCAEIEQRTRAVMQQYQGAATRAAQRAVKLLAKSQESRESVLPTTALIASEPHSKLESYLLAVIEHRQIDPLANLVRWGLEGLSWCYRGGLAVYLWLFQIGLLHKTRIDCPVISIGNLTLGGTGKTLATTAICQWLLSKDMKPAILSRGYGGEADGEQVVSDGQRLLMKPSQSGDEPFLLAATIPEALVLVGKDRRHSARQARRMGAQVLVLDDGMQYWKLQKDYEIVLVDALNPFGNGYVFPRGLLREPQSALARTQEIWITHADLVPLEKLVALEDTLAAYAPGKPLVATCHEPVALRDFATGDRIGLWALEGKRVLAISGIGNPVAFETMLARLGTEVIPARFGDHHSYTREELEKLMREVPGDVGMIITTAKDAVRLPEDLRFHCPIRILEIRLAQLTGANVIPIAPLLEESLDWLTQKS